ncbi:hypothetical protein ACVIJW_008723 [Bradyrhizobium barranii subsp. barranii]
MKSFSVSARLAEEFGAALVLQHQQLALDGADGGLGDVAKTLGLLLDVGKRAFLGVRPLLAGIRHDGIEQRAQILHVDEGQPVVVGDAEGDVEHAFLHVVQVEHAREQKRPHLRDGCPHGMTLFAEHVPEHCRELVGLKRQAHLGGTLDDEILGLADLGDAGEVTLDVGREDRNAGARKSFRHDLQRYRLTGSGSTRDEAVAIGEPERQPCLLVSLADENLVVGVAELAVLCGHASL